MPRTKGQLTLQELEFIKTLRANGATVHRIATTIKRDDKTILKALSKPGMDVEIAEQRKTLVEKYTELNHRCLDSVLEPGVIEKMAPDKRVTAAAIATDKVRLLNNESTENIGVAFAQFSDEELWQRLLDSRKRQALNE